MPIYRKPSGIWYADYIQNGRRIRQSLKTRSRAIALTRFETVAYDTRYDDCPLPLTHLVSEYRRYCERTRKPKTVRANNYRWGVLIDYFDQRRIRTISQLTRQELTQLRDHCWQRKLSNATVNRYISLIKAFIRWAYDDGLIRRLPDLSLRKLPEKRGTHRRVLTPEQLRLLIDNAPTPLYSNFIELLSLTGCRCDEIRLLKISQIDLDRRQLRLSDTKTHQALTIPLTTRALEICKSLIACHPRQQSLVGESGNPDSVGAWSPRPPFPDHYLFGGREPFLNQTSVIRVMRQLTNKLGIQATLHDLRSTFVSNLLDRGVSLKVVQELIGDKTIHMVLQVYAQTITGSHRDAVDQL